MHFSIAFALWLATFTGTAWAFFIVGGIHFLLLILFIIYRKSLIERPLVRFLANLLMSK